jgi:hypothetical protein
LGGPDKTLEAPAFQRAVVLGFQIPALSDKRQVEPPETGLNRGGQQGFVERARAKPVHGRELHVLKEGVIFHAPQELQKPLPVIGEIIVFKIENAHVFLQIIPAHFLKDTLHVSVADAPAEHPVDTAKIAMKRTPSAGRQRDVIPPADLVISRLEKMMGRSKLGPIRLLLRNRKAAPFKIFGQAIFRRSDENVIDLGRSLPDLLGKSRGMVPADKNRGSGVPLKELHQLFHALIIGCKLGRNTDDVGSRIFKPLDNSIHIPAKPIIAFKKAGIVHKGLEIGKILRNWNPAFSEGRQAVQDFDRATCTLKDGGRVEQAEWIEPDRRRIEILERGLDEQDFHSRLSMFLPKIWLLILSEVPIKGQGGSIIEDAGKRLANSGGS